MAKDHGPQINDDRQYERLRDQGVGKGKAARIANSPLRSTARKGGRSPGYEAWSKQDLYQKAKEVGVEDRSTMNKSDLIDALRNS